MQYDKSLDKVEILEDAIRARFLDGSVVDGLCIIGADGALSQVRAQICGSQVALRTTLPISALACTIYLTHEEAEPLLALHELIISASHPAERSFVYISSMSQSPKLPPTRL